MRTTRRAVHLDQRVDRVAGGAGRVVHHHPVLAEEGVEDRALADVRPAHDADAPAAARARRSATRGRLGQRARRGRRGGRRCPGRAAADTAWTSPRPSSARFWAAASGARRRTCWPPASSGGPTRRSRSATSRSPAVGAVWTSTTNTIRSASSIPRIGLGGDLAADRAGVGVVDAAGVDELEGAAVPLGAGLAPVAGDARHGVDDRVAPAGEPVEERRLADVRVADDRDDGLVGRERAAPPPGAASSVRARRVSQPSTCPGGSVRGPPAAGIRAAIAAIIRSTASRERRLRGPRRERRRGRTGGPNATVTRRRSRWLPQMAAGTTVTPGLEAERPRAGHARAQARRRRGGSPRGTSAARRRAARTSLGQPQGAPVGAAALHRERAQPVDDPAQRPGMRKSSALAM